jgi:protein SCO1/2
MDKSKLLLCIAFIISTVFTGCSDSTEVIHNLSDKSYELVNQDSAAVSFPSDFEGEYLVVGFIYTHCPDICNITTANLQNISKQLEDTSDVHYVAITFDPERDTPSVLKKYMQNFKLDEKDFTMLTGDSDTIDNVMAGMDIQAQVSFTKTKNNGDRIYMMNHTDRISVIDPESRVRFEYPGSKVPPENVIEDLNKLRSWSLF